MEGLKQLFTEWLEPKLPYAIGALAGLVVGISIGLQF